MAPRGFTAAALGVLAARDARVLFRDPDWLAVQFEMLRAFFAPYSDAPATVTRMTRGLQASLPAVMPRAKQTLDKRFAAGQQIDLSSVHRAMLAGPDNVLGWTREGLKQHMRTLVAAGLFQAMRRRGATCMQRPKLLAEPPVAVVCRAQGGSAGGGRQHGRRAHSVLRQVGSLEAAFRACCCGSCQGVLLQRRPAARSVSGNALACVVEGWCFTCFRRKCDAHLNQDRPQTCIVYASSVKALCPCSKHLPFLHCFHSGRRDSWPFKHGASGIKGAKPSFKDHLATVEGQAELRAFVQRVDARVQQDWNKLPPHLRGGALCKSQTHVSCHPSGDELDMHLPLSVSVQTTHGA